MFIFLIILFCLLYLLLYKYYKYVYRYNQHLKNIPSPPTVPILGNVLDFATDKGVLDVLMNYIKIYGDMVRVKHEPFNEFLLSADYDFTQFVLTNTKTLKKSSEYRFFYNWLGDGLITSEGVKWKKHRRIITPTFHYQILEDFVEVFESNSKILVENFTKLLNFSSVDVFPLISLCTLDIICETAMGTSINAQNSLKSEYVESVKNMGEIIISRIFTPHKGIDWTYYFTDDYKKEQKALKVIHSLTRDVIKNRQKARISEKLQIEPNRPKAFLDLLLEANDNGEQLTLEEIREEVDTFMFAGHDTIGTALSFMLYCLSKYPEEQTKVFLEQQQIFKDDFQRLSTLKDLKNMKHLEFFIKETLRLYPPSPFISRLLEEDLIYKETILPKHLTLTLFIFALHRNPKYFPEPEKFLPSRFEAIDGKKPFAFVPFSAGSRNCIGQRFAMMEMKTVLSRIIRSLEILPAVPAHELKLASQTILLSSNGICVRFRKRP